MRFAVQTILWGHDPSDYDRMFGVIADSDFTGVELFQHPEYLSDRPGILRSLRKHKLQLVGMSSGGLRTRLDWLDRLPLSLSEEEGRDFRPRDPYLVVDRWQNQEVFLKEARIAFCPAFQGGQATPDEIARILKANPTLLYLPDTACLHMQGVDLLEGIHNYARRLAAIHLKDWHPGFGRVSSLYARGFTELGAGAVDLEKVLKHLYDKAAIYQDIWVVYEQSHSEGLVEQSLRDSAKYLQRTVDRLTGSPGSARFLPKFNSFPAPQAPSKRHEPSGSPITPEAMAKLATEKLASSNPGQVYSRLANVLRQCLEVDGAAVWSYNPADHILALQGLSVGPKGEGDFAPIVNDARLPLVTHALSTAMRPRTYRRFEERELPQRVWDWLMLTKNGHPSKDRIVFRLPVASSFTPDHYRLVLDLAYGRPEGGGVATPIAPTLSEWTTLAQTVGRLLDWHLEGVTSSAGADLNVAATKRGKTKKGSLEDFCKELVQIIRRRLNCEYAALFLGEPKDQFLKPFVGELVWLDDADPVYQVGDGQRTTQAWVEKRALFWGRYEIKLERPPRSAFAGDPNSPSLLMPIVDTEGHVYGVVRCACRRTQAGSISQFSDDDLLVLDSLMQHALPTLRMRQMAEEERQRNLIVAHELKAPVAAIATAAELLQMELVEDQKWREHLPEYIRGNVRHVQRFSDSLRALVLRAGFFAGNEDRLFQVVRRRTFLMQQIVAPTIKLFRHDLEDLGIRRESLGGAIRYDGYYDLPPLFVDANMFQQVIFNLLDNAIKYRKHEALPPRITIRADDPGGDYFTLRISDRGIGIPCDAHTKIFELGGRHVDAHKRAVGSGIGLWLVRELLAAHGASITLERPSNPTTFRIDLPRKLTAKDWK